MASQSTSTTAGAGAGSSSAPVVVQILPNNRNPQIWKDFNLCLMSDNTKKAQCIHCLHFFSKDSNLTLKNHITHPHCEAKKRVAASGKSSMSRDGSIFVYNPDVLREQFAGLVIQRGLPFNHFDDEQTTFISGIDVTWYEVDNIYMMWEKESIPPGSTVTDWESRELVDLLAKVSSSLESEDEENSRTSFSQAWEDDAGVLDRNVNLVEYLEF
ncbi:hypothetical protein Tco_1508470 [Tanacetum coccineum]